MFNRLTLSISCLIFFSLSAFAEEPAFRTIKEGETFYRIAIETFPESINAQPDSVEKLRALNPHITDVTRIRKGQKIQISGWVPEPQVSKVLTEEEVERQVSAEEKN